MVKQLTEEEINIRKSDKVMMHILELKWGDSIPYLPGTENLKDRIECYTVYVPLLQKQMREFGVKEKIIPTLEQCLAIADTLEGSENRVFTERPVWRANFDENREDLTEAYTFGAFWKQFYYRLGPCESVSEYSRRTKIDKNVAFAYFKKA